MDWKDSKTYVTLGGIVVSALMAFGVLVPDEGVMATAAVTQIAGGIFGIIAVVAAVRTRKKG